MDTAHTRVVGKSNEWKQGQINSSKAFKNAIDKKCFKTLLHFKRVLKHFLLMPRPYELVYGTIIGAYIDGIG